MKSFQTFILFAMVALLSSPTAAAVIPLGNGCTNAFYIDNDCDGYGVASPLGPDADDNDPQMNNSESIIKKYGKLTDFLTALGYSPKKVYFVAADGGVARADGSEISPFGSWASVRAVLKPGDMVIYKGGEYGVGQSKSPFKIDIKDLHGTSSQPIVIMGYPGQRVVLKDTYSNISIRESGNLIIDGFVVDSDTKGSRAGIEMFGVSNVTLRNVESLNHQWGIFGANDWKNILIENIVTHDNPQEHGFYIGARKQPNQQVTIRNSLSYRNGRHGLQHNGRVENLLVENSIFHTNQLGGISLLNGVTHSVFKNNLIFNNNKQGIILYTAEEEKQDILAYSNTDNLFENNIVWIGKENNGLGKEHPKEFPAVLFNEGTKKNLTMSNNTFRKNIFYVSEGTVFEFTRLRHFPSTRIENNLVYRDATPEGLLKMFKRDRSSRIISSLENDGSHDSATGPWFYWDLKSVAKKSELVRGNVIENPKFADVSAAYSKSPEKFNFQLLSGSPAQQLEFESTIGKQIPRTPPVPKADKPPVVKNLRILDAKPDNK